jgi:hypothetical protein
MWRLNRREVTEFRDARTVNGADPHLLGSLRQEATRFVSGTSRTQDPAVPCWLSAPALVPTAGFTLSVRNQALNGYRIASHLTDLSVGDGRTWQDLIW